ncbi:hypothetical protein ACFQO7_26545 [Catellatospora aurea]|uniref:DUF2510 domain-containing protein n=1 Tax=Catellatospora aurea TaxID=1337874 RepID=A0ABW2H4X9_9ACTN
MSRLRPHWEIVTDGPVRPGALAHRYAGHAWSTTRVVFGRDEQVRHHTLVPACHTPEPEQPPTSDARSYSAGWALHRGAVACTAPQCFPADSEEPKP